MSLRTYIGPFGRIIPVPAGVEPETLSHQPNEDSSIVQLPRPALVFGTDTQLGITDPFRHATTKSENQVDNRKASINKNKHEGWGGALPSSGQFPASASQTSVANSCEYLEQPRLSPLYGSTKVVGRYKETNIPKEKENLSSQQQSGSSQYNLPNLSISMETDHRTMTPSKKFLITDDEFRGAIRPSHPTYVDVDMGLSSESGSAASQQDISMSSHSSDVTASFNSPRGIELSHAPVPSMEPVGTASFTPLTLVKPTPKVLKGAVIPGRGEVWVYEDGSLCPRVIDGEAVKAEWGVTKAGKPRKRLALACQACRDKKIKCEPAEPSCRQCEKSGRICKYMSASSSARPASYEI